MFGLFKKKEAKEEFNKISKSLNKRDKRLNYNSNKINQLNNQINSNKVKIAKLEGAISILINNKSQSYLSQSSYSPRHISDNFENRLIKKIRKNKSALVIAEISKLRELNKEITTLELLDKIVYEKKLCSRASLYRYISFLNNKEIKIKLENEII